MDNKILIVDDDEELCAELKEILMDVGFKVSTASNGTMGRSLFEKECYDVIILDIKLPGMSGIEVLKTIKNKDTKQKVLVFSGKPLGKDPLALNDRERESTEIIMKLADAVLNKPTPIEVLLSKVKELLSS